MKTFPSIFRNIALIGCLLHSVVYAQMPAITVAWDKPVMVSKSVPTLQVVVNPLLRKGSPIHDASFKALRDMNADYVRYVPWLPYPKLAVAAMLPPGEKKTSWDFSLIDPMTIDFMEATKGHPVMLNFSTIPSWLFKSDQAIKYPEDPDKVFWNYTQSSKLRDTTYEELAGYFGRLVSWYTKGGFTDELGKYHSSGHSYKIPYWEVFNEPDLEHKPTPEEYTKQYDAVVTAIQKVSPQTKFVGISLAHSNQPAFFEYFLNSRNHRPGIPLDMISYHYYSVAAERQEIESYQYTYFDKAEGFVNNVRFIENIRKRLSPATKTTINEIGSIIFSEKKPLPAEYWNLSAGLFAYLYAELTKLGIDIIGESQLVAYPTQIPSVSMMNWTSGKPNARYWVLKLIKENFMVGDSLVQTNTRGDGNGDIYAQGFKGKHGNKVLIINKRNQSIKIKLPLDKEGTSLFTVNPDKPFGISDLKGSSYMFVVDPSTGDDPPVLSVINSAEIELKPFAVAVLSLPGTK
ncbi:MAG: hypothetical protein JWP81_993 [Ferruginibacter sp.]|nr:hypothetical protein [Ferruginibacter sp.]